MWPIQKFMLISNEMRSRRDCKEILMRTLKA